MTNRTPAQQRKAYAEYHSQPRQMKERAQRNAARKEMVKKHGKAALAGKDVDHKVAIRNGGGNGKNLRIRSIKANRGDTR